jgi:hypothetical protein
VLRDQDFGSEKTALNSHYPMKTAVVRIRSLGFARFGLVGFVSLEKNWG